MSLPEQRPIRRQVALRPRGDRYVMPTFPVQRDRLVRPEPFETYNPANDARPFEWSELTPGTLVGGVLMFLVIVAFCIFAGIVW